MREMISQCLVVIPAMNESATIYQVVHSARAQGFDVLVVDDASSDDTAAVARQAGAQVVSLLFNIGAWNAIQTGLRYALKYHYQYCITMDADGQHLSQSIPQMLAKSQQADVIIAACTQRGDLNRKIAWAVFRKISNLSINDLTSGFRLYNKKAMLLLAAPRATLIEFQDVGVLLLLQQNGLKIVEIDTRMAAREAGKSRIFYSWQRIFYYMAYTLLLSISKYQRQHKKNS